MRRGWSGRPSWKIPARTGWLLLAAALLLAACDLQKLMERIAPEQDLALARRCFVLLQKRDFAALEAAFDPALRGAQLRARLEAVAAEIPASAPIASEIVSVDISTSNGHTTVLMTFHYRFPEGWRRYDYRAEGDGAARTVARLDVQGMAPPEPPSAMSEAILVIAIAIWAGGMIVAGVVIYRLFIRKRR